MKNNNLKNLSFNPFFKNINLKIPSFNPFKSLEVGNQLI